MKFRAKLIIFTLTMGLTLGLPTRAQEKPGVASAAPPLNQVQILALLAGGVAIPRIAALVTERGINFDVSNAFLSQVLKGGGDDEINDAIQSAKVTKPVAAVAPVEQARQTEIQQHMAHGTELANQGQFPQAEQEYRAASRIEPENADLYASLAYVLIRQRRWIDAESALRTTLRLDPKNDAAHNNLGVALGSKRDIDGAIAEFREALRLNPNFADAHANLGTALGIKGDVDGAIAEYREALRLNPNYAAAHFNLGLALERKGSLPEALEEYHAASTLAPNDADYKQSFERLSKQVQKQ